MKMSPDRWWAAAGFSGIAFVVLFIVGIILQADSPMGDATGPEIKSYFVDNGTRYIIGDIVIAIGFIFFFVPFFWGLSSYLGAGEPAGQTWSRLTIVYGALVTAFGGAAAPFGGALAYDAANYADEGLLRAFVQAAYYANTVTIP